MRPGPALHRYRTLARAWLRRFQVRIAGMQPCDRASDEAKTRIFHHPRRHPKKCAKRRFLAFGASLRHAEISRLVAEAEQGKGMASKAHCIGSLDSIRRGHCIPCRYWPSDLVPSCLPRQCSVHVYKYLSSTGGAVARCIHSRAYVFMDACTF